ncbi:hypothetical protein HSBAA_36680 [Vreelandella sulfidaeris]|uniref:Uncharacterized protein n=1 Tax=Vreelandella sulfidaeris TaxID=115553 RepID=A0A455U893_9GAMM|nr:hypothetical protein HSBAA_36680 [Halomonas sulfidaeris]
MGSVACFRCHFFGSRLLHLALYAAVAITGEEGKSKDEDKAITLLIANVLTPNRQAQSLIDMIKSISLILY